MSENQLAGASEPDKSPNAPSEPQEIFPLRFDSDFMDFRPIDEYTDSTVPKGSSAQVSANELKSVTGLEDVSKEELEKSATSNAEKGTTKVSPPVIGQPTSSKETSTGKKEQPAKT